MDDQNSPSGQICKIKKVIESSKLINPLLINIDNRPLTEDELLGCECSWYEDKADCCSHHVSFSNSTGDSYEGLAKFKDNLCKTVLVLQNKKTQKVQLVEVGQCQLSRVFQKANMRTDYENEEMDATYEENKAKLLKAFGSKKSNRASEIGSKMRINSEIMTSQMVNTAADVTIDVGELELAGISNDSCVPPCHRDATSADSVYRVEDFLSAEELDSMEDEAFVVYHLWMDNIYPFTEEDSGYSTFFIESLNRLQNKVSIERIQVLLFVEVLMRFLNIEGSMKLKTITLKDTEKVCPFSLIAKKLFENYTIEGPKGRIRNTTMDDKIAIHTMALLIIACESCNTEELSRYLKSFSVIKIGQIARTLCLSTRDKISWFIKLPLPPQKSFYMKRRK